MQDDHQEDLSSPEEEPDLLSVKRSAFLAFMEKAALLLVALLILLVPLYGTFEPLFEFILFAVSLATLTFPIFFVPIKRYLGKSLPRMHEQRLARFVRFYPLYPASGFAFPTALIAMGCIRRKTGLDRSCMVSRPGRRICQKYPASWGF